MYQAKALNSKWNKFVHLKGERGRMSLTIYNQRHRFMSWTIIISRNREMTDGKHKLKQSISMKI